MTTATTHEVKASRKKSDDDDIVGGAFSRCMIVLHGVTTQLLFVYLLSLCL
jgi:hypothetical protein